MPTMSSNLFVPLLDTPRPLAASNEDVKTPAPRLPKELPPSLALKRRFEKKPLVVGALAPSQVNSRRKRLLSTAPRVPDVLEADGFSLATLPSCRLRMRPTKMAKTPTQRVSVPGFAPISLGTPGKPVPKVEPVEPIHVPAFLLFPDMPKHDERTLGGLPKFHLKPRPLKERSSMRLLSGTSQVA